MLGIIVTLYKKLELIYKDIVINTSIGLKQGGPASCLFFIFYINKFIRNLKNIIPEDDFLSDLHALLLMDDTVILATSRKALIDKLNVLKSFCEESNMKMNSEKTKFFAINGTIEEKQKIVFIDGQIISYTDKYIYLGADFTDDGHMRSVIRHHCERKRSQVNKFAAFVNQNPNMPYKYKKLVAESAIFSSILFGTESWLFNGNSILQPINTLYMDIIKILLNVRRKTSNICCQMMFFKR